MATYKGYTADIKVDEESKLLVGRVLDIKDKISFHGETVDAAIQEFEKSIDSYLKFCEEVGQKPDKPFSGKLPFRTTPSIHREIFLASAKDDKSINAWMEETLVSALNQQSVNSPSVQAILDNEEVLQPFLTQVSGLLVDNSALAREDFIDALEEFLIGLDKIKPLVRQGGDGVASLVRVIYSFLAEGSPLPETGPSVSSQDMFAPAKREYP